VGRRKRGSGGITQRADGLWVGQVSRGAPDGKRRRLSFSSRRRSDVEFWIAEQGRLYARGEPASAALRTGDWLDDWLLMVTPQVKPTTARGYAIHVHKWIKPAIGAVPLLHLSPADIRRVPAAVTAAGRSPRTAQSVLITTRMALEQAVRDGRVPRNVATGVKGPRSTRRKVSAITPDRARAILAAFEDHWLEPIVTTAMGSGMRLGELLGLRWADISGERIRVTASLRPEPREDGTGYRLAIHDPKTERSIRTLEPAPFVFAALDRQRRSQRVLSEYVFTNGEGQWLDPRNVTKSFQRQLAAADLPRMRFHDLRHAYATLSLAAGVPLRVVQEALGHTSIALTASVYGHVVPELQRDAGAKLEKELFR
jgi:integrase